MHPAISVIFFTVLSGAGFGLMAVLGLGYPIAQGVPIQFTVCGLAVGLTAVGLIASTFHLGHPERALLALTQWRSSWLSREGVMSLLTIALFSVYSIFWTLFNERVTIVGWLAALCAVIAVVTTAMIYTQLKSVPHWHTPLTPVVFLLFALASGMMIAGSFGVARRIAGAPVPAVCAIVLLCAWAAKSIWWRHAASASLARVGSSPESATGLGTLGVVRLLERPHTGPNYLTKEMVHRVGRKHASKIRRIAIVFGALAPLATCLIVLFDSAQMIWLSLAALSVIAGLFAERWLFFAEAEHSVSLYY